MIGMTRIAPHHPLQGLKPIAVARHAATRAMHEGRDAIDVGVLRHDVRRKVIRDHPRRRGRTIY